MARLGNPKSVKPVIVRETPDGWTIEIDMAAARRAGARFHPAIAAYAAEGAPSVTAIWTPQGGTGFAPYAPAQILDEADEGGPRLALIQEVARVDRYVTNILYDVLGLKDAGARPLNGYVQIERLPLRTDVRVQRAAYGGRTSGRVAPVRAGRRRRF